LAKYANQKNKVDTAIGLALKQKLEFQDLQMSQIRRENIRLKSVLDESEVIAGVAVGGHA
jgi:hypothetical protein